VPHTQKPELDVIVVGAGPIGLAAALLLSRSGQKGIVLERNTTRSRHPKARGIRLRASELVRLWGFDTALRAVAMPGATHRFIYTETLAGEEIARTAPSIVEQAQWSNTSQYRVAQDQIEEILERQLIAEAPSFDVRRGAKVVAVEQDSEGVTVTAESDGARSTVRAKYLIAADGVSSSIRSMLGLTLGDEGPAPYWYSIYWRGDLTDLTSDRPAIMYYTRTGGDALVGIAPASGTDRWVTIVQLPRSATRPDPLTSEEAVALIRSAVGRSDLEVEVVSSATFRISADVADRYRNGRVFLAGDAAHTLPPTGGFGINTGLADIHNLAWKLAWTLNGEAPRSLLDSYEPERRSVALSNAAWSSNNAKRFVGLKNALAANDRAEIARLVAEQSSHVDPLDQDLGFSYAPLDEAGPPAFERSSLGARAPHASVYDETETVRSTLEVFDGQLTLVVAPESAWSSVADGQQVTQKLRKLTIGEGLLRSVDGSLKDRLGLGQHGAMLVRPDGHVAWLQRSDERASARAFNEVLRRVLADGISQS
jgi:putative polyketide hydroxylase